MTAAVLDGTATWGTVTWGGARTQASLDADIQLVEQCLAGHESAWEDLVKGHTRRVYSICYRFVGNDTEAQDLTQEVFLRIFRSLKSFRAGERSFGVWLTRLTRNLLIDHYRRTKSERATESIEEQLPMLEERTAMSARADGMLAGREASELSSSDRFNSAEVSDGSDGVFCPRLIRQSHSCGCAALLQSIGGSFQGVGDPSRKGVRVQAPIVAVPFQL